MSLDVLFCARALLPAFGGGERYVLELLSSLARGHRVRAVWLEGAETHPAAIQTLPPGVSGRGIPGSDPSLDGARRWRRDLRLVRDGLAGELAEKRPDVILAQVGAEAAAAELGAEAGVPVVLLLPSYDSLCRLAFVPGSRCLPRSGCRSCPAAGTAAVALARDRTARERALLQAAELVAPSRSVADVYEEWTGRRPVPVPPVAGGHAAVDADQAGPVVVPTAGWSVEKGVRLLEPIARALPERRFRITRRWLPRPTERALTALPHVELVDYRPLAELLDRASVLLVPSQWREPFGRIAFEGLSAGVPTLASEVGGLPEFVPPDELVRPHDDPSAWTDALRALDEPARWRAARTAGRAAAGRILATRPLERVEEILVAAASGT